MFNLFRKSAIDVEHKSSLNQVIPVRRPAQAVPTDNFELMKLLRNLMQGNKALVTEVEMLKSQHERLLSSPAELKAARKKAKRTLLKPSPSISSVGPYICVSESKSVRVSVEGYLQAARLDSKRLPYDDCKVEYGVVMLLTPSDEAVLVRVSPRDFKTFFVGLSVNSYVSLTGETFDVDGAASKMPLVERVSVEVHDKVA